MYCGTHSVVFTPRHCLLDGEKFGLIHTAVVRKSELFGVTDLVFSVHHKGSSSLVSNTYSVFVEHFHFRAIGVDLVLVLFVAFFAHKCCLERWVSVLEEVSRHLELKIFQLGWWIVVADCVSSRPHSESEVQWREISQYEGCST